MKTNKTHGEKARVELNKNATCSFEQILEATPHKTAAVRSLTSDLKNHLSKTNKTYGTLLEKQRWTQKRRSSMNFFTVVCKCWLTNLDLHLSVRTHDVVWKTPWDQRIRERESEKVRKIYVVSVTWWWCLVFVFCLFFVVFGFVFGFVLGFVWGFFCFIFFSFCFLFVLLVW